MAGIGDILQDYGREEADGVNQQGVGVRREIIWLPERDTDPNTVLENRKCSRFSAPLTKRKSSKMDFRVQVVQLSMIKQQA